MKYVLLFRERLSGQEQINQSQQLLTAIPDLLHAGGLRAGQRVSFQDLRKAKYVAQRRSQLVADAREKFVLRPKRRLQFRRPFTDPALEIRVRAA